MILGSGLLARAFAKRFALTPDVMIYAAGVSNSSCTDSSEFQRERSRLERSLEEAHLAHPFVYFSTCSLGDPAASASQYVHHKAAMERLVSTHPRHLIVRLPQLAGHTPNPHTLLNYLFARISRGERFTAWRHASRNVIDVQDVERVVSWLLTEDRELGKTVNVASPRSASVAEIVRGFEEVVGKPAVVEWVDRGISYVIDVSVILPAFEDLGLAFDERYLPGVLKKYYG